MPRGWWRRFYYFCTKHKGFIDTVILGLLTVAVGYLSILLAMQNNWLVERQTKVMEAQASPFIVCRRGHDRTNGADVLVISNNGVEASGFHVQFYQFLKIHVDDGVWREVMIPVMYFDQPLPTSATRGLIVKSAADPGSFWAFERELSKRGPASGYQHASAELLVYAEVRYTDLLGRSQTRFCRIPRYEFEDVSWLDEGEAVRTRSHYEVDPEDQTLANPRDREFAIELHRWLMEAAAKNRKPYGVLAPVDRGMG